MRCYRQYCLYWRDEETKETTCFFIGSRFATATVQKPLDEEIERHIAEYGVTEFVVGHYGNFDLEVIGALQRAKKRHPEVTLLLLIPYHPYDRPIKPPAGFDGTYYPEGLEQIPKRLAIVRANRYMVDHSGYLIAYIHGGGNSRDLAQYAKRREARGLIHVAELTIS